MLFNSYEFIFFFLPVILLLHHFGRRYIGFRFSLFVLVAGSFFFYAWWNPPYLAVFVFSIVVNFYLGRRLSNNSTNRKFVLTSGISFNLLLLGYYKYTNFVLDQLDGVLGLDSFHLDILLPIGISFYTFQQIAFLVDSYKKKTDYDFMNYCLFVSFFPQLIAGPIVHHAEMMPQFSQTDDKTSRAEYFGLGIVIFTIGLFKKVIVADNLALFASPIFAASDTGIEITFVEAWLGVLAYSLQLYFDFSGYSDMAIGLASMFGIRLPWNFNSPYKSRSIIDFWRRWHMTLSRFLRDYLYIPLGGNRDGSVKRYRNLMLTMAIGGMWHGAGWGFLIWGVLHGAYLIINNLFSQLVIWVPRIRVLLPSYVCWSLTLLAIIVAWVPFRATNFDGAIILWRSMLGLNDMGLPVTVLGYLNVHLADNSPWQFLFQGNDVLELQDWIYRGIPLIFCAGIAALYFPNSHALVGYFQNKMVVTSGSYVMSRVFGFFVAVIFLISLSRLNSATEFMYFQF